MKGVPKKCADCAFERNCATKYAVAGRGCNGHRTKPRPAPREAAGGQS